MIKNKFGFTLMEIMVTVIIIGILASVAIPGYINSAEKFRGAEAREILSKCYAGYQRLLIDEEDVSAGKPLNWSRMGISDPSANPRCNFSYDILPNANNPSSVSATRIGDNTKWLSIDLSSGCLTKSSPY